VIRFTQYELQNWNGDAWEFRGYYGTKDAAVRDMEQEVCATYPRWRVLRVENHAFPEARATYMGATDDEIVANVKKGLHR